MGTQRPHPGAANTAQDLGSIKSLSINEWMARPENGSDWLEIYNRSALPVPMAGLKLSDDPAQLDKTVLPPLTFIAGNGYLRFIADNAPGDGANHVGFRLSGRGEEIVLSDTKDKTIDSVMFAEQARGVSEGRYPDGDKSIVTFPNSATPGRSNLVIGDSDEDGLPNFGRTFMGSIRTMPPMSTSTRTVTATATSRNSSPAQHRTMPPASFGWNWFCTTRPPSFHSRRSPDAPTCCGVPAPLRVASGSRCSSFHRNPRNASSPTKSRPSTARYRTATTGSPSRPQATSAA